MSKMRKKHFLLLLCVFIFIAHPLVAQLSIFRGIIIDSITNKPLQNVKIYRISEQDTSQLTSDISGAFQVVLSKEIKLHFRKDGYGWHSIIITDNTKEETICLLPSKPAQENIGQKNIDNAEIIFDGKELPRNQWDDACSIRPSEIASLTIYRKDGKIRFVFESKPKSYEK